MNQEQSETSDGESPILCDRCLKILSAGRGEFYEVQIEAVADPSPPDLDAYAEQDSVSLHQAFQDLAQQLSNVSEQEGKDQVFRRLKLILCNACFPGWIENPAGDTRD